jgi:hypothetical protein
LNFRGLRSYWLLQASPRLRQKRSVAAQISSPKKTKGLPV